jgi:hypothetical protein
MQRTKRILRWLQNAPKGMGSSFTGGRVVSITYQSSFTESLDCLFSGALEDRSERERLLSLSDGEIVVGRGRLALEPCASQPQASREGMQLLFGVRGHVAGAGHEALDARRPALKLIDVDGHRCLGQT